VQLWLEDYRKATGSYDAAIAIGIMEHVGNKNYPLTWRWPTGV
jgi:cyclopropane fatty-acyl-phospholipid synthase-like methyltransferase